MAQNFQTKEVIIRKIVEAITGNGIADEIKEVNNNVVESNNEGHNDEKNNQKWLLFFKAEIKSCMLNRFAIKLLTTERKLHN